VRERLDYITLYEAWKQEKRNNELQPMDKSFYVDLSKYIRALKDELRMLDDETFRAKLSAEECDRVDKLSKDLIWTRFRKIDGGAFQRNTINVELLTAEEEMIYLELTAATEKMRDLERKMLRGRTLILIDHDITSKPKRLLIRFRQALPAIIGPDTKTYGPFKEEDVAFLPVENAESLIRRGVAVEVKIE
jgi:DNA replication initiation complex subunit (GINS family)